jgi:hypothetical protein
VTIKKLSLLFFLPIFVLAGSPLSKVRADYAFLLSDDANSTIGKSSRHVLSQFKEQLRIRSNQLSSDYAPRFSDFGYLIEELEYSSNEGSEPHMLYVGLPSSYLGGMLHFDFDGEKVSIDSMWQELAKHSSQYLMIVEMPPQAQRPTNMVWPNQVPSNVTFIGAESSTKLQSAAAGVNHPYASDFALTLFLILSETGQDQQSINVKDVTERLRNRLEAESVWSNADQRGEGLSLPTFIASEGSYYSNWLASETESRRKRELAAQKAKEAEEQRKRELAEQRAREAEERRKRDLAAQRAREAEEQRKRELAAQRAREAEERRKRELAAQRAREAGTRRERELAAQQAKETNERRRPESKRQQGQEQEVPTQENLASEMGGAPEGTGSALTASPDASINPQFAQAMARLKALEEEALRKEKEIEELKKQEASAKKKRKNTTSFGF